MERGVLLATLTVCAGTCLRADFSYEQTSRMTGGLLATMTKVVGVFSRQAREPVQITVLVKGDRMAHLGTRSGHIIDLAREIITEIDFQKKTYSVVTFAQMAETLKQLEAEAKSKRGAENMNLKVEAAVKETGRTKQFSGLDARQVLMSLEMEAADPNKNEINIYMVVNADLWLASQPGYEEVRSFRQRLGQKLNWTPGGAMFSQGRSEIIQGLSALSKELAKMDAAPVFQVVKMGLPGGGDQPAAQPQEQPQRDRSTASGALGRIGGKLGGLAKRKKSEPQPAAESAPAQPQPQDAVSMSLLEMTTELSGFSTAPADPSRFEVPAGFRQVESDAVKALRR